MFTDFENRGEVRRVPTPSGDVDATAHRGDYSDMAGAYEALEQWCKDNGRRPAGLNWEIYGDWDDDPVIYFSYSSPRRVKLDISQISRPLHDFAIMAAH